MKKKHTQIKGRAFVFLDTLEKEDKKYFLNLAFHFGSGDAQQTRQIYFFADFSTIISREARKTDQNFRQ